MVNTCEVPFLYKNSIFYRVLGYISNSASFEITEINNRLKGLVGEGGDDVTVRTLRGRG